MSVYLLILMVKKRLELDDSVYKILQILSVSTFNKMPFLPLFLNESALSIDYYNPNQLLLFDL